MKKTGEIKQTAWESLSKRGWMGPIIISMFSVLLTVAVNAFAMFFQTNSIITTLAINFCLYVCIVYPFNMGMKIYILKFLRGAEVSVGDVFDGYGFALKMIPLAVISMVMSELMNLAGGLAFSENVLYYIGGIILLVISFVLGTVADFSLYLIYDNDGKVFKSIYKVFVYLIKGGIIKVTVLMFSFIFWWIGVIISAGMLTFFVYPYMEVSRAVLYEDVYNLLRSDK